MHWKNLDRKCQNWRIDQDGRLVLGRVHVVLRGTPLGWRACTALDNVGVPNPDGRLRERPVLTWMTSSGVNRGSVGRFQARFDRGRGRSRQGICRCYLRVVSQLPLAVAPHHPSPSRYLQSLVLRKIKIKEWCHLHDSICYLFCFATILFCFVEVY